jgi:hypothetical protein
MPVRTFRLSGINGSIAGAENGDSQPADSEIAALAGRYLRERAEVYLAVTCGRTVPMLLSGTEARPTHCCATLDVTRFCA